MAYIIAFGVLIAVFVYWIISIQRSFVALDENINNAMSQIAVQLSSRWDALTSLIALTKEYAPNEYEPLIEATKTRRSITKDSSPDDIKSQGEVIAEIVGKIATAAESRPDLKADMTYIKTVHAVNQYESMLRTSRLIYNDSVSKLNRTIRLFPTFMIAGMLGFTKHAYLETVDEK